MPTTSQPSQRSRINLGDLKLQIAKKLGPERCRIYFSCLNQLLAQKLSKRDFNKYCLRILGRQNIPLHNQLIQSILKNAFRAKTMPLCSLERATPKPLEALRNKSTYEENINHLATAAPTNSKWSNGYIFPPSPRKVRSCIRERRNREHAVSIRQNGGATSQSKMAIDENTVIEKSGAIAPHDLKRSMQHHQGYIPSEQRPLVDDLMPQNEAFAKRNKFCDIVAVDIGQELQQSNDLNPRKFTLQAPLGIPLCPASLGGARRAFYSVTTSSGGFHGSNYSGGELCDTEALQKRMGKMAEILGLERVTLDCSNLLNNALDTYLKGLIRSCIELSGTRLGHDQTNHPTFKQEAQLKPTNGFWSGIHLHVHNNGGSFNNKQRRETQCMISFQDFRVAMELNRQQLGEDWPSQLEKICFHSGEDLFNPT
ncbi:uncharacterized protein LOC121974740 [Zingiber officinale]|uniref:Transcriptional coactivator Hfi1/Transcriptional adapter 1 n=1 Tax=Zingiber officinale TaxID=94328 RepID=A0A8J5L357_ZINOF|nr:uncharacterized protein LOC121974740 [Zingiber officinale]XP_042381871.1 uncharacterized protein LOC121974740 [Zingiber officinale]KAG6509905.1 hypothetical protein ZIOFF_027912 [Zingiber officinale]